MKDVVTCDSYSQGNPPIQYQRLFWNLTESRNRRGNTSQTTPPCPQEQHPGLKRRVQNKSPQRRSITGRWQQGEAGFCGGWEVTMWARTTSPLRWGQTGASLGALHVSPKPGWREAQSKSPKAVPAWNKIYQVAELQVQKEVGELDVV